MKTRPWLAVGLFFLSISRIHAANLLANPGFETNAISPSLVSLLNAGNTMALPGWTVSGGNCAANCVLILDTTYTESSNIGTLHFLAHGGSQSLDLTGNANSIDGGVQQVVNLAAGNYQLSFWLGNMDNNATNYPFASAIQVLINGSDQGTFSNNNNTSNQTNWQQMSFNFIAPGGGTTILFRNATGVADNYAGLDDVFLDVAAPAGVPEPATFGLAALGLGSAAFVLRLRRKRSLVV